MAIAVSLAIGLMELRLTVKWFSNHYYLYHSRPVCIQMSKGLELMRKIKITKIPTILFAIFNVLVIPGGIGIAFLPLILFRSQVTFDRSMQQIQKCNITPFGLLDKQTYSISDIKQVMVKRVEDSENGSISFWMKVELQEMDKQEKGQKTLMQVDYGKDESKARTEAWQLGQFLGCPIVLPQAES